MKKTEWLPRQTPASTTTVIERSKSGMSPRSAFYDERYLFVCATNGKGKFTSQF